MGRRRGRRRRAGAGSTGLGALLVSLVVVVFLAQRAVTEVTAWASERTAVVVPALAVGLIAAGGLGVVGFKRSQEARRREELRRKEELAALARRRRTLEWWDALSPYEFEAEVASLMRRDGYQNVRRIGGRSDGGVDVTGRAPDGTEVAVQCKHYAANGWIGVRHIRDFHSGALLRRAKLAVLVTTAANASRDAQHTARRSGVELVMRDRLARWAQGTSLDQILGRNRPSAAG